MEDWPLTTTAMATVTDPDVTSLKGTTIVVTVEEALLDVIIASFNHGSKIFQGALLDLTKNNCPYGIYPSHSWHSPAPDKIETESTTDCFHALKQRHTYFQATDIPVDGKARRPFSRPVRDQGVRMRRLRPRQVLCSHCREICNENSENVQAAAKKAAASRAQTTIQHQTALMKPSPKRKLIPELTTAFGRRMQSNSDVDDEVYQAVSTSNVSGRMILRKRKFEQDFEYYDLAPRKSRKNQRPSQCEQPSSKTVFEDDEAVKEEVEQTKILDDRAELTNNDNLQEENDDSGVLPNDVPKALKVTPVIKISFANPQGTDTVLKIPAARLPSASPSDGDEESTWYGSGESVAGGTGDDSLRATKDASAKAAKKALKKAKKEAQRKSLVVGEVVGPMHRHKHHKHKVKRKRKRRDDNFQLSDEEGGGQDIENDAIFFRGFRDGRKQLSDTSDDRLWGAKGGGVFTTSDGLIYEEVKNKCLRQKLSINLKRLNAKAYMRCSPRNIDEDSNVSVGSAGSAAGSDDGSDLGSDVPDFPRHEPMRDDKSKPLMMRISSHSVKKCILEGGREMEVGDIVWGKIHGFPWWPGKVLSLTVSQRDNGVTINQQAHVAWFGSSTSSLMPCNQLAPFLDDFKTRYNKKKRGPYKEAIRQATLEAHQNLPSEMAPDVSVPS